MWSLVENNILYSILILLWIPFLWQRYLSMRQRALVKRLVDVPPAVTFMNKDVYDKARSYSLDKLNFENIHSIYNKILSTSLLLMFYDRHAWNGAINLIQAIGLNHNSEIMVSCAYLTIVTTTLEIIGLPFRVYGTFFLEAKHGFNKQTPLFFIKDQILKYLVLHVLMLPFVTGTIWIIKNGGDYFFLYLWAFFVIATLFVIIIYPEVIAPLFDKYYPLPEGDLKKKIEALAASVKYPLYKLFIVEGSKRSSHSNAYLYGFHKNKRIVLFDTLVKEYYKPTEKDKGESKGCETDEVLAVLAHEIGHWKYNHTFYGFLMAQVIFFVDILSFAKLLDYKPMYEAFGFTDVQPTIIGLYIISVYILIPFSTIMHVLQVYISRKFEFQADRFARSLGHGEYLQKALIKLQKDNLSYPMYDKLYSAWHHSHPPLIQRLEAIAKDK